MLFVGVGDILKDVFDVALDFVPEAKVFTKIGLGVVSGIVDLARDPK